MFFTSLFTDHSIIWCHVTSAAEKVSLNKPESVILAFLSYFPGFQGWCCSAYICCAARRQGWQDTRQTGSLPGRSKICTYEARGGVSPETAWWLHNSGSASKKSNFILKNECSDLYSWVWSFLCHFMSSCAMQWELKLAVFSNPSSIIIAVVLLILTVCPQICALLKFEVLSTLAVQWLGCEQAPGAIDFFSLECLRPSLGPTQLSI